MECVCVCVCVCVRVCVCVYVNHHDMFTTQLIHCAGSVSRATVFAVGYAMHQNKLSAVEAMKAVKGKWAPTYPNDNFIEQLCDYEKEAC